MKLALVASSLDEVKEIQNQLNQKNITNVDVYQYNTDTDTLQQYDAIEINVRPNKTKAQILDLAQSISTFGFPEDEYNPPESTGDSDTDRQIIDEATRHLRLEHLSATLESDHPEPVTRELYKQKLERIKANNKRLSQMSDLELSQKFEVSEDPTTLIAIAAIYMDKLYGEPMTDRFGKDTRGYTANNGKKVMSFYNPGSIEWISELWNQLLPEQIEFNQRKYIRSLKTRIRNMVKEQGSIWGLRYFIEYLIKNDRNIVEVIKEEQQNQPKSDYEIEIEEFDIQQDIPF